MNDLLVNFCCALTWMLLYSIYSLIRYSVLPQHLIIGIMIFFLTMTIARKMLTLVYIKENEETENEEKGE